MTNALAKFAVVLVVWMVTVPIRGWAIAKVWGWFIVPLGAPAMTTLAGAGISVVA